MAFYEHSKFTTECDCTHDCKGVMRSKMSGKKLKEQRRSFTLNEITLKSSENFVVKRKL